MKKLPKARDSLAVAIATETRAEYGLLLPVYRAIDATPGLTPTFLASGMHHLARFGRTIDTIRADGVRVRVIRTRAAGDEDSASHQADSIGRAVDGYARAMLDFDWLVVLGDRLEMLAAATAATALGKPIAHLHGGDIAPGAHDDAIRHAITKLAHLHFPATAESARRIRRLGEPAWRIRTAGAPGIDAIRQLDLPGKNELDQLAGFDTDQPFAVVVQHAAGFPPRRERKLLLDTLAATAEHFERAVVIGAGVDAGSSMLHDAAAKFAAGRSNWKFLATLPQADYFGLLWRAAALIGNSSSGIIEAAHFRLAVVDIGPRQAGRQRSCNVLHCDYGRDPISRAIARVLHDGGFRARAGRCRNIYGRGLAGATVAAVLARTKIDRRLMVKALCFNA